MQRYQDSILNSNGQPVSGLSVLVSPTGTTNTASVFGDIAGATPRTNPLTTDSLGSFWFYGTNGRYDFTISGAGIQTATKTDVMLEDVPLSNLGELSTASAAVLNLGGPFFKVGSNLSEGSASAMRASVRGTAIPLASTGQISPDLSQSDNFSLAMTVNTTLAPPANPVVGQQGRIVVTQNSTAKTLAVASSFWKFVSTATLSTAANAVDVLRYAVITSTSAECEMRNNLT